MLNSLVKVLCVAIGLVLSGISYAVSMDDINVANSLGEPLSVSIGLGAASKDEIGSMSARLAPPEVFKEAGLEYPSKLPPLTFRIETNAKGESYIRITSEQPINESFVNLLVELTWSSGRLLREYIFLLDSPEQAQAQSAQTEINPIETSTADVSELEAKESTATIEPELPNSSLAEGEPADEMPGAVTNPDEGSDVVYGSIKVNRGDTLSKLALQTKPADVSLERALVALYRANVDAFNGNMNRLKVGRTLYMPVQSDLNELSQAEAVKEIRAQANDWHAYRQRLAAASKFATEEKLTEEASGKISTTVADQSNQVQESAKEVVRLSRGDVPGDKATAGNHAKSSQNKMNELEEEMIAKSKALEESRQRVAALEKNVDDLQRLVDLRGQPPIVQGESVSNAAGSSAVANTNEVQPGAMQEIPVSASEAAAASAVEEASLDESAKPITEPEPEVKKSSFIDVILGDPLYLAGGAAALFGLVGLGYVLTRRKEDDGKGTRLGGKPAEHIIDPLVNPIPMSSGSTHPKTNVSPKEFSQTNSSQARADDFDPISGADLFLSFGHEDQAEKILKEGLGKNPANPLIYLKLLSIYANREDVLSFNAIARQLKDLGDANSWEQAVAMGSKLEPNNPMYSDKVGGVAEVSAGVNHSSDVPPRA